MALNTKNHHNQCIALARSGAILVLSNCTKTYDFRIKSGIFQRSFPNWYTTICIYEYLQNQYLYQRGRCGVCGDPNQGPKDNEAGGRYATGTIARAYSMGEVIDVTLDVTADHKGWFEFRLCPNNNPAKAITHACLNQNVLPIVGSGTR